MTDPELDLDGVERADLAMMYSGKGWPVLLKLLRAIVEQFRVDLDNANPASASEVMAKHSLSKAAGRIYTILLNRVSAEVTMFGEFQKKSPQEGAPGLELDDIEEATANLPNLLGDVNYVEEDSEEGR